MPGEASGVVTLSGEWGVWAMTDNSDAIFDILDINRVEIGGVKNQIALIWDVLIGSFEGSS
jgi:hypothetical protein